VCGGPALPSLLSAAVSVLERPSDKPKLTQTICD